MASRPAAVVVVPSTRKPRKQTEPHRLLRERAAGVLLHVTSLSGGHGIGDLGLGAHRFVDWLHAAGCGSGRCCRSGRWGKETRRTALGRHLQASRC